MTTHLNFVPLKSETTLNWLPTFKGSNEMANVPENFKVRHAQFRWWIWPQPNRWLLMPRTNFIFVARSKVDEFRNKIMIIVLRHQYSVPRIWKSWHNNRRRTKDHGAYGEKKWKWVKTASISVRPRAHHKKCSEKIFIIFFFLSEKLCNDVRSTARCACTNRTCIV